MGKTWTELKATSDEELVAEHDREAKNTAVGIRYYTEELHHRDVTRSAQASEMMAAKTLDSTKAVETMTATIKRCTQWMVVMNVTAVVIALAALVIGLQN
jgi:hypothetical protein